MNTPILINLLFPLVALGVWVSFKRARLSKWISTEGEVVEIRIAPRSSSTRAPVVSFQAADGRRFVHRSTSHTSPSPYRVGDQVPGLYDPQDPNRAAVAHFGQLWGLEFVIGIALTAFDLLAVVITTVKGS